jgi:hypothetical protein
MTLTQEFRFDLKRLGTAGEVEGFAAGYGNRDRSGEAIRPGAFARSLEEARRRGVMPAMLLYHDPARPAGRWLSFEERPEGLHAKGALALDTADGAEAYRLLKAGAIGGLSVGFIPQKRETARDGTPEIVEADLVEVSFTPIPANPAAVITSVKAAPGVRDIEKALRALGLSQRQATLAAGAAARALAAEAADPSPEAIATLQAIVTRARGDIAPFARSPLPHWR